ncbi:hypothetical protein [Amphritea sp. HPY]|uniref:hypothetical protein n=1 Tax=Amphritea sp. HPY TaxID=3421652 RepID=UPI003D7D7389
MSKFKKLQNAASHMLQYGANALKGESDRAVRNRIKTMRLKPFASDTEGEQLPFEELCRNHKGAALRIYNRKVKTVLNQSADARAMREVMSEFGLS